MCTYFCVYLLIFVKLCCGSGIGSVFSIISYAAFLVKLSYEVAGVFMLLNVNEMDFWQSVAFYLYFILSAYAVLNSFFY